MNRIVVSGQVKGLKRRAFLKVLAFAGFAVAIGNSGAVLAATPNFTLYGLDASGARVSKVDVYHTRSNGIRCEVFERDSSGKWVRVGPGHFVSVRQAKTGSRFDEVETDANGETRHSAMSYTSGMSIEVVVPDFDISGDGTIL